MTRTALYIDIEGFASIYPNDEVRALQSLGRLMNGIIQIGAKVFPDSPNRLFAHQTGDGFVVVSEFHDRSSQFLLGIPIVLMRYLLTSGGIAKTGVADGKFGDIQGCYPDIPIEDGNLVRLGGGLLRTFSCMGTALINANKMSHRERGALLLLDSSMADCLPEATIISKKEKDYVVIDWIHTDVPEIPEICEKAGLSCPSTQINEEALRSYVAKASTNLPDEWKINTISLNGCDR